MPDQKWHITSDGSAGGTKVFFDGVDVSSTVTAVTWLTSAKAKSGSTVMFTMLPSAVTLDARGSHCFLAPTGATTDDREGPKGWIGHNVWAMWSLLKQRYERDWR